MKQNVVCLITICLPFIVFCQSEIAESAIAWTQGLTWKQVQQKAKSENKYIFVDCYATWCKPCKEMDKKVYTVDSVGDYLNVGFISIKLQMDETANDNADVKSWYRTANEMRTKYSVSAYPSYLFFAPNGEVVSKATGYKDPASFLKVTRDAIDPSKQYFVLLKKYKQQKLDHAGTVSLIKMAQQIGDTADYRSILNSYYACLNKLKKEKLYTKENIEFVAATLDRSSHVLFKMFYPDGREVNKVMRSDWYARTIVDNMIFKEKVNPFLGLKSDIRDQLGGGAAPRERPEPDWKVLHHTIANNYKGDYAARIVLETKMWWFLYYRNHMQYARALNDKMEKYRSDTTNEGQDFRLNTMAAFIWEDIGSTAIPDKESIEELSRTAEWMQGVVRRGASASSDYKGWWHYYIDTYANLLYKIGKTDEAITWEELAIAKLSEVEQDQETVKSYAKQYENCIAKMRKGEPTWPIKHK